MKKITIMRIIKLLCSGKWALKKQHRRRLWWNKTKIKIRMMINKGRMVRFWLIKIHHKNRNQNRSHYKTNKQNRSQMVKLNQHHHRSHLSQTMLRVQIMLIESKPTTTRPNTQTKTTMTRTHHSQMRSKSN